MSVHLPTYLLYGEDTGLPPAEVMHAESIAERSSLHSWEIRAHRHESLMQIFSLERGRVEISIDGDRQALRGPCVITIMPLAVHGFVWTSDVRGTVFTLRDTHLRQLLAGEPALGQAVLCTRAARIAKPHQRELRFAVASLREEYGRHAAWRSTSIDGALMRLCVALGRSLPSDHAADVAAGSRAQQHVQRFRALVDERFREQPTLVALATELGITPTQLNRVCRAVVGHPALVVLHARICLEAQRELTYTTMSIKHIAFKLGFTDAGYFTRFFKRESGSTPSAWRAAALAAQ